MPSSRPVPLWRLAALAGATLGLLACGGPAADDPPVIDPATLRFDLVAESPAAELRAERSRLRPVDPDGRARLLDGWSYVESDEQGSYVWSDGTRSEVGVFLTHPRGFELIVHGGSFQPEGAEPLDVAIEVNGTVVGSFVAGPETAQFRTPISADVVRHGDNHLSFVYSRSLSPIDTLEGSQDTRQLALRLYSLELRGLPDADLPSVEDGALVVPAGTMATWYAEVRAGDALEVAYSTDPGAAVAIRWWTEAGADGERSLDGGDRGITAVGFEHDTLVRIEVATRHDTGMLSRLLGDDSDPAARLRGGIRRGPEAETAEPLADVAESSTSDRRPDILIYLVDTLRADRLGLYGYDRPTSPRLDEFAGDAVTFTEMRSQTSWTRTAVVSMFTGLYPPSHGVEGRDDGLPAEVTTLAEHLRAAGYRTVGMTTNGNVSPKFGVDQGFDIYQHVRESRDRLEVHRLADDVERWVATWLGGEDLDDPDRPPFLLYAHATDPHAPYTPREPFKSRFAADADPSLGHLETMRSIVAGRRPAGEAEARQISDLYDAEIAFTDHYFGALLDRLRRLGLYDDMVIVFVSDHGEEFFEHGGWEHGRTLYDEQLRVPLVVKLPGSEGAGLRLGGPAGHVDVLPTLLDVLGLPAADDVDGRSLLPSIRSARDAAGALQLAYLKLERRRLRSLVDGRLKLIEDLLGPDRLFDLTADPGEQVDLAEERALRTGYWRQRLRRLTQELERDQRQVEEVELDAETREQLEALGYVQ